MTSPPQIVTLVPANGRNSREAKRETIVFFFSELNRTYLIVFIIWLNWSMVKRSILIGSLSGPNLAIRTAKMDRSRTEFADLCS